LSRRRLTAGRPGVILEYDYEIAGATLYLRVAMKRVTRQTVRDIALGIS